MVEINNLEDLYENAVSMVPGHEFEYRGYLFKKCDGVEHSVYMLINRDGKTVENLTIGAYDSFEDFKSFVDKVIDYDPEDGSDWLNRNE